MRRWIQLDDGRRQLTIIKADPDAPGDLREYTPGDFIGQILHAPATDRGQLTTLLASLELGWVAAAAAWTCHLRAFTAYPPPAVLAQSLAMAGEQEKATEELVINTALETTALLDRLERPYRTRADLVEDWHTVAQRAGDVPALQETADWLLDQIALRDAHAQQLRAVLEPDITDHLRDRHHQGDAAPALDEARTAHLVQARDAVRAYTAAAHSGREQQAQQLLDVFPIPERTLEVSDSAAAWRRNSSFAQAAVDDLAAQRMASAAEDDSYPADPELRHAATSYPAARQAQLHREHEALGRFTTPVPAPSDLPGDLLEFAAGLPQRRLSDAFGSPERARQVLHGRIDYLQQQPVPAHRKQETSAELALLQAVGSTLDTQLADTTLDDDALRRSVASRVEQAMSARRAEPSWRPPSAPECDRRLQAQPQASTPQSHAPGLRP